MNYYIVYDSNGKPVEKIASKAVYMSRNFKAVSKQEYESFDLTAQQAIFDLKKTLADTDYRVIKCAEAQIVGSEMPYNVAELHAERQAIRNKINRLEG